MNLSISIKEKEETLGEVYIFNGEVIFEPSQNCSDLKEEQLLKIIKLMQFVKGEQNGN